ncbi:hypothetical protein HXA31_11620 [Salipaludibacillus agaradhaerens]|uniref:Uncharacterized protein n=1 Tax=Salipaludibacillus agaradhaerens TaxID=76935 RepID=A0A9Q4FXI3_SALAG|nr:hypothetical protein [Salipaludibacillus agaradhaerens]MCR6095416.1 hypothetical protein [Salipaludibacillus agaradhaerens]MCR6115024.1 hypothetical protein [Salipaludibacillus agaradhaerens]
MAPLPQTVVESLNSSIMRHHIDGKGSGNGIGGKNLKCSDRTVRCQNISYLGHNAITVTI